MYYGYQNIPIFSGHEGENVDEWMITLEQLANANEWEE